MPFAHPYRIDQVDDLDSPALVVFRKVLASNLRRMIEIAGDLERLRPHVKTHKMPAIVRMLEAAGVHHHKCATIAEAEMIAQAGGRDVLLAYPLVGPNPNRFARLARAYPETTFRAVVDHVAAVESLADALAAQDVGHRVPVLVDLDVGMGRTGVDPEEADAVYEAIVARRRHLIPGGLHAYDGHIRHKDLDERRVAAIHTVEDVRRVRDRLERKAWPVPRIVLGGTPTFPIHAKWKDPGIECSPGTCLLHDHSYGTLFPDLPFTPAALLLTRVVSVPRAGRLCLDLGYKAVAADPSIDRVRLLGIEGAQLGPQSEEHLVVINPRGSDPAPGTPVLAIPTHVCPTCLLYREAIVVEDGAVVDRWDVQARDRAMTV